MKDFFEKLVQAPDDPILGIVAQFLNDPRPEKINLSVGVYFNEEGQMINFPQIDIAQRAVSAYFYEDSTNPDITDEIREQAKLSPKDLTIGYLPTKGYAGYDQNVQDLVFPPELPVRQAKRIKTMETVAGSGALSLAAYLVKTKVERKRMYLSDPTWSNHFQLFGTAGLECHTYFYLDHKTNKVDFERTLADISKLGSDDAVLLQASCHNPTGFDFTKEQWLKVLNVCKANDVFVVFDCAYQGFGNGLDEDVWAIREASNILDEYLVCYSCSKNFGLYGERVGALHIIATDERAATLALENASDIANNIYIAPGSNGAYLVSTVCNNPELFEGWKQEVNKVNKRIKEIRQAVADRMAKHGIDYSFIAQQNGMFSYAGLTEEQVIRLRDEFAIYLVTDGRINVIGINQNNVDYVCDSFAKVILGK